MASAASAAVSVDRFFEFSLLGLLTSGFLAVAGSGYLDLPTAALTAAGLLARALFVLGILRSPMSPRIVTVLTAASALFYPIDYQFISRDFLSATVHLVFFLAFLKVLTARTGRDFIFLGILAFLELLAASILSTNLNFFLFLALFMLFGVAAFASSEIRRSMRKTANLVRGGQRRLPLRLGILTLTITLGILALTGGLFFLLPRTAQAAFRHFASGRYHVPGFSNEMTLGEIGEIQQTKTPVMHVRMADNAIRPGLKWRGNALTRFDGKRWFNPPDPGTALFVKSGILSTGEAYTGAHPDRSLRYEVQIDAIPSDALFLAGAPDLLIINVPVVIRTATGSYRTGFGNSDGLRYGASAYLEGDPDAPPEAPAPPLPDRASYLQLPRLDPRVPEIARDAARNAATDLDKARALERYLRRNYAYTTELPSQEFADPLANFLCERKKGHCEYFASAMAVMLRTLGVPSRVATGFQSGVYNPVSGWYVIRASDAHSWVEAYLEGRGWTTFDPTPPDDRPRAGSVWSRIAFYFDAADTFWKDWVVNYDPDRQLFLASSIETSGRRLAKWLDRIHESGRVWASVGRAIKKHGPAAIVAVLSFIAAWLLAPKLLVWLKTRQRVRKAQRGMVKAGDASVLYVRMQEVLRRRGLERPSWITPSEFARSIPSPETAALVADFTQAYNELRFGGAADAAPRMAALLEAIEHAR